MTCTFWVPGWRVMMDIRRSLSCKIAPELPTGGYLQSGYSGCDGMSSTSKHGAKRVMRAKVNGVNWTSHLLVQPLQKFEGPGGRDRKGRSLYSPEAWLVASSSGRSS